MSKRIAKVLLWLLSVAVVSCAVFYINAYYTGGTVPVITISTTTFKKPSPTSTRKPSPTATRKPSPVSTQNWVYRYPSSGTYFAHTAGIGRKLDSEFTITTPYGSTYYCIVLVKASDPSQKICSIFVHPGKTVTVSVPCEQALVYYTAAESGSPWLSYTDYFGDYGLWSTSDDVFDFEEYTWSITLEKVSNGNWDTESVRSGNVPFLN